MFKERFFKNLLLIGGILFFSISIIFPLGTLFIKAFYNRENEFIGFKNFQVYLNDQNMMNSLINSLKVSILVTIIVMIMALLFAFGVNRSKIKGKKILDILVLLPLFTPTMTHGIGLIYLFGKQGLITRYLGININIYGYLGIIISECIFIFPVLYLMYSLSFQKEDYRLYEVADLMGINKIKQFLTITIPNIKYSLITGIFTAFTLSFTDFGAPKIIGGNYNVLSIEIFKQVIGQQNMAMGATVGIFLLIPAIIAFVVDILFQDKKNILSSDIKKYRIKDNLLRDIIYSIINYGIIILNLILFVIIIVSSLVKNWPYNMTLSFNSYTFTIMGESIWSILCNSLLVSILSAIFGTSICFFMAYIIEREQNNKIIRKIGYFLSILPNAIPGLTVGLAYIFFFNLKGNPLHILYGTFWILILANIIHFFATPFLTITSDLKKIDKSYEAISDLMGVKWYRTLYKVIIPLSLNSILESFSYYFINSMITISAVIFLYTANTRLISVMMISKSDAGDIAGASAVAVIIMIINIIFKIVFKFSVVYVKNFRYIKNRKSKIEKAIQSERLLSEGKEILRILNKVSKETKVKYWLEFGTLLGKVRDNNFIGHDINFDIGIMEEELTADFLIELEKNGFERENSLRLENKLKYLKYIYNKIEIEIFLFERKEEKVFTFFRNNKNEIMGYKLSDSSLEEIKFMGIETKIPRNATKRLIEIYGENYRQPDPSWKDEMSPHIFYLK